MQIRDSPCGIKARQSTLCLVVFIHQQFLKVHLICLALATPRVLCLTLQTLPRLAFPCMPMPHPCPACCSPGPCLAWPFLFLPALPFTGLAFLCPALPTTSALSHHSICFHRSDLAHCTLTRPQLPALGLQCLACMEGKAGSGRQGLARPGSPG